MTGVEPHPVDAAPLTPTEIVALKGQLRDVHGLADLVCAHVAFDAVVPEGSRGKIPRNVAIEVGRSAANYAVGLRDVLNAPGAEWPMHVNLGPDVFGAVTRSVVEEHGFEGAQES